jgi:hypothetical protein
LAEASQEGEKGSQRNRKVKKQNKMGDKIQGWESEKNFGKKTFKRQE